MSIITVEAASKLVREADVSYEYDSEEASAFTAGYIKGVRECLRVFCVADESQSTCFDSEDLYHIQQIIADELGLSQEERKLWNLS